MPRKKEIQHKLNEDVLDLQIYPEGYFDQFDPTRKFMKYACVEVNDEAICPEGMELLELQAGKYAIFTQALKDYDPSIFEYIYGEWLPSSSHQLDSRPHFDVLSEEIQKRNPNALQTIWIPIR